MTTGIGFPRVTSRYRRALSPSFPSWAFDARAFPRRRRRRNRALVASLFLPDVRWDLPYSSGGTGAFQIFFFPLLPHSSLSLSLSSLFPCRPTTTTLARGNYHVFFIPRLLRLSRRLIILPFIRPLTRCWRKTAKPIRAAARGHSLTVVMTLWSLSHYLFRIVRIRRLQGI